MENFWVSCTLGITPKCSCFMVSFPFLSSLWASVHNVSDYELYHSFPSRKNSARNSVLCFAQQKIEAPWKNKGEGKWEEKKVSGSVTLFVLVQNNFQDLASGGEKKSPLHSQPDWTGRFSFGQCFGITKTSSQTIFLANFIFPLLTSYQVLEGLEDSFLIFALRISSKENIFGLQYLG